MNFTFLQAHELCGSMPLDIESIIESIEMLDRELEEFKRQAKDGHLRAKPDETVGFFPNVGISPTERHIILPTQIDRSDWLIAPVLHRIIPKERKLTNNFHSPCCSSARQDNEKETIFPTTTIWFK